MFGLTHGVRKPYHIPEALALFPPPSPFSLSLLPPLLLMSCFYLSSLTALGVKSPFCFGGWVLRQLKGRCFCFCCFLFIWLCTVALGALSEFHPGCLVAALGVPSSLRHNCTAALGALSQSCTGQTLPGGCSGGAVMQWLALGLRMVFGVCSKGVIPFCFDSWLLWGRHLVYFPCAVALGCCSLIILFCFLVQCFVAT